jgi:hypothetical protein
MRKLLKQVTTWVSILAVVGACIAITAMFVKPVNATQNGNGRDGINGTDGDAFYLWNIWQE